MEEYTVYFINKALMGHDAVWGCEAVNLEDAKVKFSNMHRSFCAIKKVAQGNFSLDQMRNMKIATVVRKIGETTW